MVDHDTNPPSGPTAWSAPPSARRAAGAGAPTTPSSSAPEPVVEPTAGPAPWWGPDAGDTLPSAPPEYDPQRYGTPFGAAGGSPADLAPPGAVPPLPGTTRPGAGSGSRSGTGARSSDPAGSPRAPRTSTRAVVAVGVLSALIAAAVTGGLFLAFGRNQTAAGQAAGPTTGPAPTLVAPLDIYRLLDRAQPSVVSIRTNLATGSGQDIGGAGSGVIISEDGLVLTNAHVVAGASTMQVTRNDGSTSSASLVGSFPDDDVALIRIKDVTGLQPAELGSSGDIKVGDPVVAIGNALNLGGQPSVTEGIVSAKNRDIQTRDGTIKNLIQTDAAINPGNSGGPLLNAGGQVVGINTAIIKDAQNIGFAISIDTIKPLIEALKDGKGTVTADSAFMGVSTESIDDVNAATIERYKVTAKSGAFVSDVVTGSGAAVAGLQPGDVITAIDGQTIASSTDVGGVVRKKKAGDTVTVEYQREGRTQQATVTLKSRSESGG